MAERPMGPNVLWLTEALCERMTIEAGMRVLDLGCGMAFSSVFVASEFGVNVVAADLWIEPTPNWERVRRFGLEERIFPLKAEAHTLPFPRGYFDAVVSLDAYHYFGTNDLYLSELARFVRPGGEIGMVVPGLREEFSEVPAQLAEHWEPDFWTFHAAAWWQRHWERSGCLSSVEADFLSGGFELWLQSAKIRREAGYPSEREELLLAADGGRYLGFVRMVGRVT
jgi:cyclopropane fatty-acyl-phospholipid synthase-like methyltransferase